MPLDFDGLKENTTGRTRSWKPKPGENEIRVLPPTKRYFNEAIDYVAVQFRSHFVKLEKSWEVFRCLRDLDQACPACNFYFAHKDSDDENVAQVADYFSNSIRYLYNFLVLAEAEKGVQPYECGPMVNGQLVEYLGNPRWGECLHPGDEGRNFFLKFTPANESPTRRNNYSVEPDPEKSSVVHHLPEGWADTLDNLEAQIAETRDADAVQELVDIARIGVGLPPEGTKVSAPKAEAPKPAPAPEPETPKPEPTPAPEAEGAGDAAPKAETPTPEPEASAAEPAAPEGGGPAMDPETDLPVCYGGYEDRHEEGHPCDACDHTAQCQLKALGL